MKRGQRREEIGHKREERRDEGRIMEYEEERERREEK